LPAISVSGAPKCSLNNNGRRSSLFEIYFKIGSKNTNKTTPVETEF